MASAVDATTPLSAEPQDDLSEPEQPSDAPLNAADEDEDDEDVVASRRRRAAKGAAQVPDSSTVNGGEMNEADDEDDQAGLFGDEDDEGLEHGSASKPRRTLNDSELDSGDDLDRQDRLDGAEDDTGEDMQVFNTMAAEMGVHPVPDPTDGELYLLTVPRFLAFESHAYDAATFQPPTTDLHSKERLEHFSAHKTAMSTIRWRKNPSDPAQFQSNARILRWSDGSLTLQMAATPATQYLMPAKPLAPRQHNPPKPTPTSTGPNKEKKLQNAISYSQGADSLTYLSVPSEQTAMLRITNKLTTHLSVQASVEASQGAVEAMRAAYEKQEQQNNSMVGADGHAVFEDHYEDPEAAQRRAEKAEKETAKAQRKRENQEFKNAERTRTGGGTRRTLAGGLHANLLEGEDELGAGMRRRRPEARGPRQRRRQNRGEIYSDDEDEAWGQRGRTKEDEYDEDDGFLVGSDEEEEDGVAGGDDDDEEDIDEGIVLDDTRGRKRPSPADEQDAEGEPDEDDTAAKPGEASPTSRTKRRRVIDDEDEE